MNHDASREAPFEDAHDDVSAPLYDDTDDDHVSASVDVMAIVPLNVTT